MVRPTLLFTVSLLFAGAASAQVAVGPNQPTKEVAHSDAFRKAATVAIVASRNFTGREAGFAIRRDGTPAQNVKGEPVVQQSHKEYGTGHDLHVLTQPGGMGIFHIHPEAYSPQPSLGDIAAAKKNRMVIYVASCEGLYAVGPDGKISQIFQSKTWYVDNNPK